MAARILLCYLTREVLYNTEAEIITQLQKAQWPYTFQLFPSLFLPVVSKNVTGFAGLHSPGRLCVRSLRALW